MKAKQKLEKARAGTKNTVATGSKKPNPVKPAPKPNSKQSNAAKKLSLKEQIEQARLSRLQEQGRLRPDKKVDPLSYAAAKPRLRRKLDGGNQAAARMERKQQKQAEREAKKKARQELRAAKKIEREKQRADRRAARTKVTHNFRPIRKQEEVLIKKYGIGSFIYDAPIPQEQVLALVKLLEEYAKRQGYTVKVVAANGDGIVLQDASPRPKTPNWMGQYLTGCIVGMALK